MININELEKVLTSGKVVTLIVIVDGVEQGALSFTLDTVAFKKVLETVAAPVVTIAEKPVEKKPETKKSEIKKLVDKQDKTKAHPEFNPIPATAENTKEVETGKEEENESDYSDTDVDIRTGEIKEHIITPHDINTGKATVADAIKQQNKTIQPVAASIINDEDIIPEQTIVADKKETAKTNEKDEKAQASSETKSQEINFTDEKW